MAVAKKSLPNSAFFNSAFFFFIIHSFRLKPKKTITCNIHSFQRLQREKGFCEFWILDFDGYYSQKTKRKQKNLYYLGQVWARSSAITNSDSCNAGHDDLSSHRPSDFLCWVEHCKTHRSQYPFGASGRITCSSNAGSISIFITILALGGILSVQGYCFDCAVSFHGTISEPDSRKMLSFWVYVVELYVFSFRNRCIVVFEIS